MLNSDRPSGLWLLPVLATLHACAGTVARGSNGESSFCDGGRCRVEPGTGGNSVWRDSGSRVGAGFGGSGSGTDAGLGGSASRLDAGTVQCDGQFPSFDRTCAMSTDCTVVSHRLDCCGTTSFIAIAAAEAPRFAGAEAVCGSRFPICGCAPGVAPLDDGTTVWDMKDAAAECVQGECRSRFKGSTFPCGDKTCKDGEFCLQSGTADPLGPDGGPVASGCFTDPSCLSNCDSNPCVFPGCSCLANGGHVTIGCQATLNGSTCNDLSSAAEKAIDDAFAVATEPAELSCSSDDDCVIQFSAANCTSGCRTAILSTRGMGAVWTAIDFVNLGVCAQFDSKGCAPPRPPCPLAPTNGACMNGTCVDFPPATWLSFSLYEGKGADSTFTQGPANCSTGHDCTLWRIFPDGSMQKWIANVPSPTTRLSAADLGTIDSILRSQSFRQMFATGSSPACPPPPAGILVSFDLQNRFWEYNLDFTGCALAGPSGSDPVTLYDVVRKY